MPSHTSALTTSADSTARTWDGSPQTKYEWFESLQHSLTTKDISFRTLWQSGYAVDRSKVLVSSIAHAQHLSVGNVEKQTFDKPTNPLEYTLNAEAKDVSDVKVDPARYVVAPEMLDAKDRSLFAAIADTIDNKKRREDYERKTDGSGLRLIALLANEIDQASAEISQWAARRLSRLADVVATGVTSPTTVGFDHFRKQYEEANAQLPSTRRNKPSVIADTYVAAVRQLGDSLGTRLDMQLTLARIAKGKGSQLELDETVSCILDVLGDSELRHPGRALKNSKENKPQPFVWTEGRHEICNICKGKHGGGKHLRRDCPDKPTDPVKKPRTERPTSRDSNQREAGAKGAAKRAVASEDSDDSSNHDLWESDAPLSALFEDHPEEYSASEDYPTSSELPTDTTGAAYVARQRTHGAGATPAASTPPTRPSLLEARRLVESLSPVSPMKEFAEVERTIGSGVSLRTGGADRRSRIEILNEMRSATGLPPTVIPVGLPVGPSMPSLHTLSNPDPPTVSEPTNPPGLTPPRAPPDDAPSRTSLTPARASRLESSDTSSTSNPLGLVQLSGAPTLSGFHIRVDSDGRVIHEYSFESTEKRSWIHPAAEAAMMRSPPAHSVYLGHSTTRNASCWGTESGELILCLNDSLTNNTPSTPAATNASAQATPPRGIRRDSQSSPIRNLAVAIISLAGALAAVALGSASSPGQMEPPFDPGEPTTPDPGIAAIAAAATFLIGFIIAMQAKRRRGGRGEARRLTSTAPPNPHSKWESIYFRDCEASGARLGAATSAWRHPISLASVCLHHIMILTLSATALRCGLVISSAGGNRPMLPTTSLIRCHRNNVKLLGCVCLTLALHAGAFTFEPLTASLISAAAHRLCPSFGTTRPKMARPIAQPCADFYWMPPESLDETLWHFPSGEQDEPLPDLTQPKTGYAFRTSGRAPSKHGRAFRATRREPKRNQPQSARQSTRSHSWARGRALDLVIDSGCTWHVHNRLEDLVNVRPCGDVVEDAAGDRTTCTKKGDLPLMIRNRQGVEFKFILRDVRWAPGFPDSLVSVDQLWETSKADCIFRDEQHVQFTLNLTARGDR